MGKRSRGAKATETRKVLVERFPKAFAPPGQDKRPLKIGIFRDLVGACPDLSKTKIGGALNDYTGGPTYLRNMVVGATRIDLRGEPSGTVDEKGAEHAAEKLAAITARKRPQPAEEQPSADA